MASPSFICPGSSPALRDEPSIRLIQTRHEQGAAHVADGYARVSGKPGVMLLAPGAGLYNAASGIASAYARSSPVLAIVGQIPRAQIGKGVGAVHEVLDQADVVRPSTEWRRQILRPREAPDAVTEAFRQMRTGRPRPVLIELPPETGVEREDVQLREPAPVSRIVPSPNDLRRAVDLIMESRLPVIYAGGGVAQSNAEESLVRLAEATNIPVITSSGGKGTIPDRHPLSYGSCFGPRADSSRTMTNENKNRSIQFSKPCGTACRKRRLSRGTSRSSDTTHERTTELNVPRPSSTPAIHSTWASPSPLRLAARWRVLICPSWRYPVTADSCSTRLNSPPQYNPASTSLRLSFETMPTETWPAISKNPLDGSYGTDPANPDIVRFAESFGAVGMRANNPSELATLLPEALGPQCAGPD